MNNNTVSKLHSPVWFITGCSTGFGRELAKLVLAHNYRLAATARDVNKIQDIVATQNDRAIGIELDVTKASHVDWAVKKAETAFGGIDVLVNNAGYGYLGAVEESDEKEARAMFETNFWGLSRVIHAVLPGMRKRHSGTIVNISSIGGLVGFPGFGYYSASKFAVEGLTEALSQEVAPLGIRVILVEPGPFRTSFMKNSAKDRRIIQDYQATAGETITNLEKSSAQLPGDPVRAAEAMLRAIEFPEPPLHLLLGKPALQEARGKLGKLRMDFDAWEETTLTADFPESLVKNA